MFPRTGAEPAIRLEPDRGARSAQPPGQLSDYRPALVRDYPGSGGSQCSPSPRAASTMPHPNPSLTSR